MQDIIIKIKNTSYIQIKCPDNTGILHEIHEKFSYYAPGYQFHPKYKIKAWDGKIRLFNLTDDSFPYGLFPELVQWAKSMEYSIGGDMPYHTIPITEDDLEEFAHSNLKLPFDPRDYQLAAAVEALKTGRILNSRLSNGLMVMIINQLNKL